MTIHEFLNDVTISDSLVSTASEIILKTLLIALLAWLAIRAFHRSSAAFRHLVCTSALVAVLLVPLGVIALPSWNLLPEFTTTSEISPSQNPESVLVSTDSGDEVTRESNSKNRGPTALFPVRHPGAEVVDKPAQSSTLLTVPTWGILIAIAWAGPALFYLANIFRAMISLHRRSHHSQINKDAKIERLTEELTTRLMISKPKVFIEKSRQTLPMVWGIFQGRLYLPADANEWSEQKLREVLLHELAHLKRRDPLALLLGQLARAIFWFNPLIRILNRQMVLEQEVACDDEVLRYSSDRASYASTLLEMTVTQPSVATSSISAAMAGPLQIDRRIRYLLDENRNRKPTKLVGTLATLTATLGLAVFVSCLAASPVSPDDRVTVAQESETTEPNKNLVAAVEFLQSIQDENDQFAVEEFTVNGVNALGAIALTYVGELADKENQARAIRKVAKQDVNNTYELSLQLIALCQSGNKDYAEKIRSCIKRLCELQAKVGMHAGGWSYARAEDRADGSNTRFAVWALFVAHQSGYDVPEQVVERSAKYWIDSQLEAGGWAYVPGGGFNQPTVTMNLSGIVCLSWSKAMLDADHPLQEKIAAGITKAWSIEDIGEKIEGELSWPYYGLHLYALAAETKNWELEGLNPNTLPTRERLHELLAERQNEDGSYDSRSGNFKSICTSLAILTFEKP